MVRGRPLELIFMHVFNMVYTISKKLENALDDIGITDDKIDDIEQAVVQVVGILQQLPQLMPQFHMNNNPLTPIIEMIRSRWENQEPSLTAMTPRTDDGRFSDGTQTEETHNSPTSETND